MAAVLHDKLADLGDPRGQWQRWQSFILGFPVVWKRLVKSFSAVARSPGQQVPPPIASWPCYECGMTFKTSKTLASHQARSHHEERLSGRYVKDGNCPLSGAFFHTRRRAMHHVDFGSKACEIPLLSSPGLPELTEDEIALARQQDRLDYAATKARGVWAMQDHQLVRPWEVGQGRTHNACSGDFWSTFCCFIWRFHCNVVARLGSSVSVAPLAPASSLAVPLSLLLIFTVCAPSLGGSVTSLRCSLPRHCRIPTRALVRTVPHFLMDSLSGWCFVRLDLRVSPGADGFSSAFVGRFEYCVHEELSSLCFFDLSQFCAATTRVLACKATASTSSSLELILKFNGVLHQCDHGLSDGPRHFGQFLLRVMSRLWVMSLDFACASALLNMSVHVDVPFAGSSSSLTQES